MRFFIRDLRACQAVAAEPVELDAGLFRSVARQQLDILHRQEQLVAAGIVDFQAVVRRARRFDGAQADEAADAVIDMDDEIAGGEARHLGDEILRPLRSPARAHQALAQNVFFGDEREVGGLEAGIDAEHGERDLRGAARPAPAATTATGARLSKPMLGEHVRHALARARRSTCAIDDALAGGLQPSTCFLTASKTLVLGSLRSAAKLWPACVPISIASAAPSGAANGDSRASARTVEPLAPFGFGKIEPVRRQRLVRRAASPLAGLIERILARLIIIGDLRQPLVRGFLRQRLDRERRCLDIIEQRLELPVKQRQPMLDAGGAAAFAHRFVEHVVGRGGAEGRDIAGAEQPDGLGGELELGHRHQIERAQFGNGALGLRIEAADRFQRVAEEIEPHRLVHAGREQIDDAAAHRVIAGLAHGRGAGKAVELEPLR